MSIQIKSMGICAAVLFLITIGFGIWMAQQGKPYGIAIFTIHKLTAIGAVVLAALFCYNLMKNTSAASTVILLIIVAVISVIALLSTGALMSAKNTVAQYLRIIHIISTIMLDLSGGGMVFALTYMLRK